MNRNHIIKELVSEREQLFEQLKLCQSRITDAPLGKLKTVNRSTFYEYYIRKDSKAESAASGLPTFVSCPGLLKLYNTLKEFFFILHYVN